MLGTEPQIIEEYVDSGQVKIVFWPMIDFGPGSHNAHAAAHCVGLQDPTAFWQMHDFLFANQSDVRRADGAFFAEAAAGFGADRAAFEACYESGAGHSAVTDLDSARKRQGILNRPTFDIDGQLLFGNQSFEVFEQAILAALR